LKQINRLADIIHRFDGAGGHAGLAGRLRNLFAQTPDRDQAAGHFGGAHANDFVAFLFVGPQFQHIAQHSHPVSVNFREQVEGCQSGFGRGIVGVIND